ncbi:MAG: hypothetical protein R2883_07665 [Caldisericia bacterium]
MRVVEFEGSFDKEKNISFVKFINTPKSKEDIDYFISNTLPLWEGDGVHKCWNITDLTGLGKAPPSLVIYYNKQVKPYIKKHLENYVVIAGSVLEKVATSLFNTFMGERHPIVSTLDEAMEIVKKWQAEKGVFSTKIGE